MALSTFLTVEVLLSAAILCYVALIAHRLWVSPLAKFPGPRLAAATSWYETYYDVVKDGLFFRKIQRLHRQYGTSVPSFPTCAQKHDWIALTLGPSISPLWLPGPWLHPCPRVPRVLRTGRHWQARL